VKQLIQSFKTRETILEEVPVPLVRSGHVLIKTSKSLVSLGTERMLVEFGKSNLISKARQQPEKVKQVLDKIKSEGLLPTLEAVFNKLEQPIPLGYCNVGVVVEVGTGVKQFKVGDRVASNGPHAEYVCMPVNLTAHIPDNVSDEEAAFTVISAIGLQGVRLIQPTFGETFVVIGLGLIGLLTVQLLLANGCEVIGVDIDSEKVALAQSFGAQGIQAGAGSDPVKVVEEFTNGVGADGVLITASAKDAGIMSQSARMCRKRGRIVLVGVVPLELNRSEFYEKELSFQVSCSYGPGRYDENYEQQGHDYPLPFVRWTEKRNFESILAAISAGKLNVKPLITEIVPLESFKDIYGDIGNKKSIASILSYKQQDDRVHVVTNAAVNRPITKGGIGIIGAGNYTKMTMLPALKKAKAEIQYIASNTGVSGTFLAKKYGIEKSTTDYKVLLSDPACSLIIITTRHDLHDKMVVEGLLAGKHVFVEKPLSITQAGLDAIREVYERSHQGLMVGYNRRFSPFVQKMKTLLGSQPGAMNMIATMNAGHIPANVWVHDMQVGGGRIIGEACHFIDLMIYLTGSKVKSVYMEAMGTQPEENTDNAIITLKFESGAQGVIQYFANGNKAYSKERVEVYHQGRTLIMDNYRKLQGFGFSGFSSMSGRLDKGHEAMFARIAQMAKLGGEMPIAADELFNSAAAALAAIESLKQGKRILL
jgi:predicted dehydrogenase/threonine dehydrogenase-like Zn-dependent dehydrogenase